jgi:TonB family protein
VPSCVRRFRLRPVSSVVLLTLAMIAALAAAPNEAAAIDITPLPSAPKDGTATGLADWRLKLVGRIEEKTTFPVEGYCREGVVKVRFMIDRSGNLLSTEVAESSDIMVFDAEALAILKRANPFPPPPAGIGGPFVSLTVPIRFRPYAPDAVGEKRFYLNLKSDLTLTLDGAPVQSEALDRVIRSKASNDKSTSIIICADEHVPAAELSRLAERVKAAGFRFALAPRPGAESD